MNPSGTDSVRVDIEKLADQAQELGGSRPLQALARLAEMAHPEAAPGADDRVSWKARGERRRTSGQGLQTWLHLQASTRIALTCQRCLQPLDVTLEAERSFRFVAGEEEAARLDAESEEDVLASSRSFDLLGLVEDELLLSLPLVPRHEDCRMPLPAAVAAFDELPAGEGPAEVNPFAALAALKERGRGN